MQRAADAEASRGPVRRSRGPSSPSPAPRPTRPTSRSPGRTPGARRVRHAAAQSGAEALTRTPDLLPVLRDAGVVDAGGRGLSVILDAAETVLTGCRPTPSTMPARRVPVLPASAAHAADLVEGGPSYEVMYLLDAADDRIPVLKKTLAGLGDSLVVVGNEGLWNVHVHVDDVGAAIEAGIEAGRPHQVRVTHFAEQARERVEPDVGEQTGRRIVTVAAGPGLAGLFAEAGAVVVQGGPGRRPSTGQLLEAITSAGRPRS